MLWYLERTRNPHAPGMVVKGEKVPHCCRADAFSPSMCVINIAQILNVDPPLRFPPTLRLWRLAMKLLDTCIQADRKDSSSFGEVRRWLLGGRCLLRQT